MLNFFEHLKFDDEFPGDHLETIKEIRQRVENQLKKNNYEIKSRYEKRRNNIQDKRVHNQVIGGAS